MMMKLLVFAALSAVSTASVASAEQRMAVNEAGHWEWQSTPSYGPRAPLPAPHRVWVPDSPNHSSTATPPAQISSEAHQAPAALKSI